MWSCVRAKLVAAILVAVSAISAGCLTGSLMGEPAPAFSLVTSDGDAVNETTHLGKFLILDLMATWCGPCILEVSHLREIQNRFGDRVEILSIGIDPSSDTPESLVAFSEKYGATWPHALDAGGEVSRAYKLGIVPKLIILDPEGKVVLERQGEVLPAAMARVIDPSAAGASPTSLFAPSMAALGLGFLAVFNPYRRFHREGAGRSVLPIAGGILAGLAILAWVYSGFASSRATYGSLFGGVITLAAVAWWFRARRKEHEPKEGRPHQVAFDRAYEAAPHFALVLVLGLNGTNALSYFLPVATFLGGAYLATQTGEKVAPTRKMFLGLMGLLLAGLGLVLFGSRILLAEAA